MRMRFFMLVTMLFFGFIQFSYADSCCSTSSSSCADKTVGLNQTINIKNNSGQSIDLVCKIPGYTEAVLHLKKLPRPELRMELFKAILKDDADRIKLIVQAGVDINQEINNIRPLALAIKYVKPNAFNVLLECDADYNFMHESITLVHYALMNGQIKIVRSLIENGADLSGSINSGRDIMFYALNSLDIAKLLIDSGYNVCSIKEDTLHCLLGGNRCDLLCLLLKKGLNPNMVFKRGPLSWGLLSYSVYWSQFESVKALLEAGANPNSKSSGKLPLSYAMEKGNIEMIELLESYGAHL